MATVPFTHPPRPVVRAERPVPAPKPARRSFTVRPQAIAMVLVLLAALAVLAASAQAFDMAIVLAVGFSMQLLCLWTCAKDRR